jgi:elongation factor Ts
MAEITAELVKKLRDKTNVGMMDCKIALSEADGDMEKAVEILRKKGKDVAAKKSGRATNQGLIASRVSADSRIGVLVEINCETDFVARNEIFQAFVADVAAQIEKGDPKDLDQLMTQKFYKEPSRTMNDFLTDQIAKIGENMKIKRFIRFKAEKNGSIMDYIHMGGKIGVLVMISCSQEKSLATPDVKDLLKNISMQIAASAPTYVRETDIPASLLEKEKEIQKAQIKGKPDNIVEKIVEGKLKKFYADVCLLHQPYVKEPKMTVADYVSEVSKKTGDKIAVEGFARFVLGEEI